MREIKFRAKCTLKGKWMYGSYRFSGSKHYINSTEIHRDTLGQFTGIKDKNGVEIYEGDIVDMHYFYESGSMEGATESENNVIGVVGIDIVGTYTEKEDEKYLWLIYLQEPEEELEVLTNIHDNPELLERESDYLWK